MTVNSSYSGETWIEVEITSPLGGTNEDIKTSKRITFWVGKPTNNQIELGVLFTPPFDEVCIDQMMDIGVGSNTNATTQGVFNYQWQFGSWDSYVMGYDDLHASNAIANIMLDAYAPEMQIVSVSGENICGCDNNNLQSKTFYAVDCGGGWYMSMYPNPASDYVTVSFVATDEVRYEEGKVMIEDKDYRDKELKEYTIEIWDEKRGVVKRVTSKEKYLQIPVNDLAPGRYYFHLIYNGKTYKQQLIVE